MTVISNSIPNTFPNLYNIIPGAKVVAMLRDATSGMIIYSENDAYKPGTLNEQINPASIVRDYGNYTIDGK